MESGAEILEGCTFGDCTSIGSHCMIGAKCIFKGHNMMGPNVHIYTTNMNVIINLTEVRNRFQLQSVNMCG